MNKASGNKFKIILMNMQSSDRLNFIWLYDQYVQTICAGKDENSMPCTIEDFYHNMYKRL